MGKSNDTGELIKNISDSIFHQNLTTKPFYYDYIIDRIFTYDDLPRLLRHPLIRTKDESIPIFLSILKEYFGSLSYNLVAILCSGSGLLSEELLKLFPNDIFELHHFDYSRKMLEKTNCSSKKILVDLSKPIEAIKEYDLLLSLGSLRYFSECLPTFAENIRILLKINGYMLIGEVDHSLISNLADLLNQKNFTSKIISKRGVVFRNTLFYFILDKYKRDCQFRKHVLSKCLRSLSYEDSLINLAGFKEIDYFYCIAQKQDQP